MNFSSRDITRLIKNPRGQIALATGDVGTMERIVREYRKTDTVVVSMCAANIRLPKSVIPILERELYVFKGGWSGYTTVPSNMTFNDMVARAGQLLNRKVVMRSDGVAILVPAFTE